MERSGLRLAQAAQQPLYEHTRAFRVHAPSILPGLVQTEAYTAAVLRAIQRRRSIRDDVAEAVGVRMDRQQVLHEGDHRFVFLIEESALTVGFGGAETMAAQLGHLVVVSAHRVHRSPAHSVNARSRGRAQALHRRRRRAWSTGLVHGPGPRAWSIAVGSAIVEGCVGAPRSPGGVADGTGVDR